MLRAPEIEDSGCKKFKNLHTQSYRIVPECLIYFNDSDSCMASCCWFQNSCMLARPVLKSAKPRSLY